MTSKSTTDSLIKITRELPPEVCQLAHLLLAHDESLPANIKNGLSHTLLTVTPLEPTTRLGHLVCEIMVLSTVSVGVGIARELVKSHWAEVDEMDSRPAVAAVLVWFAQVCNIVMDDPDIEAAPVLH
jgi:hypothetical protein